MNAQIVIRCPQRQAYLTPDNQWSGEIRNGRRFTSAREADDCCRDQQLHNVELLVQREGHPDLRIPIRITWRRDENDLPPNAGAPPV